MWRGPRRKISAEETAANAARKLEREASTMTCQCCGRKHLANRGWIAHHGYTRPGYGYQTASCFGAKALPFEVDRSKLGEWIDMLKVMKHNIEQGLAAVVAERVGITLTYSFIDSSGRFGFKADRVERIVKFTVTRATWDGVVAAEDNVEIFRDKGWTSFDNRKASEVAYREYQIRNVVSDIKKHTERYEGWKQTHKWNGERKEWEGA